MLSHTSLDAWITIDGGGNDLAAWAAALLCGPVWWQNMPAFERRRNGRIACTVDVRWSIGQTEMGPDPRFRVICRPTPGDLHRAPGVLVGTRPGPPARPSLRQTLKTHASAPVETPVRGYQNNGGAADFMRPHMAARPLQHSPLAWQVPAASDCGERLICWNEERVGRARDSRRS